MSIIRVIVVDPWEVAEGRSDLRVFQVPEHSAEFRFLTELLNQQGIEWVIVDKPNKHTRSPEEPPA